MRQFNGKAVISWMIIIVMVFGMLSGGVLAEGDPAADPAPASDPAPAADPTPVVLGKIENKAALSVSKSAVPSLNTLPTDAKPSAEDSLSSVVQDVSSDLELGMMLSVTNTDGGSNDTRKSVQ